MQYLLPPVGKEHQVSFKAPGHDQVNRGSDGLFRVDVNALADLMVQDYGFRPASHELIASTASAADLTAKPDDGDEDDVENGEDAMNESLDETEEDEADDTEVDDGDESEAEEEEEDFESMDDDELKAWLEDKDVGYPKSVKRPQLLKLANEEAARLAAEDEEED